MKVIGKYGKILIVSDLDVGYIDFHCTLFFIKNRRLVHAYYRTIEKKRNVERRKKIPVILLLKIVNVVILTYSFQSFLGI